MDMIDSQLRTLLRVITITLYRLG